MEFGLKFGNFYALIILLCLVMILMIIKGFKRYKVRVKNFLLLCSGSIQTFSF